MDCTVDLKEGTISITERTLVCFWEDTTDNTAAEGWKDQTGAYMGSSSAGQQVSAKASGIVTGGRT